MSSVGVLIPDFDFFWNRDPDMTRRFAFAALILIATHAPLPAHAADAPGIRSQTVQFAKGATSAQLRGSIKGDASIDYKIDARAGQTLSVTMKPSNASNYFNINPPGSDGVAMFIGSSQGAEATVMLPTDGIYVVRVYLMRNAARRNETSNYTLTVGVTGKALAAAGCVEGRADPRHQIPCVGPGGLHPAVRSQAAAVRGLRHPARLRRDRHRRGPRAEFDAAPHPVRRGSARRIGLNGGHGAFARRRSHHW